ncbi:type II secretion system major pseudopilin GspG [Bradyrhizobium roseum]|uniref:type II secretion system major pseudopilin GspG n=1 Tax=Bradyrhizobium roseum TaxID=3056648 RepID=UPI0026158C4C|nr:type II secretion system major pseudopilin GspG [Bradyrhizobium roseus]WKA30618.1 type II secretion system major pseudopilin GspG [Bradyrhizobium roseus]
MVKAIESGQAKQGGSGRMARHRRRKDAGYTLLELLVVMGILAVLTAIATPQLMGYFGKAKTQSVQLQIENIGTALELYYMENGNYPSASAGLKALVEASPEAPRWNGPYLKKAKNLLDPWGRPYQYAIAEGQYEVYSLGPTGKARSASAGPGIPGQMTAELNGSR